MRDRAFKICAAFLLTLLVGAGAVFPAHAGTDDASFTRFQGTVTETAKGYFIVSSRKVELLDMTYAGKRYTTEIFSIEGEKIQPQDVRKGDLLWIMGQTLPNGNILANAIYLQTHE